MSDLACELRALADNHAFNIGYVAADQIESDAKRIAELQADKAKLTVLVDELRHQIAGERKKIKTLPPDDMSNDPPPIDAATQEQGK